MVNSQVENFSLVRKLLHDLKTRTKVSCARSFASSSLPTMRQRKWKTDVAWRSIKSLSAASWPACNFSMSARSWASMSFVSMHLIHGIGHRLFHLPVQAEREFFHFLKI